jgi:D-alanine-D-alanine ligase
MTKSIITTRKIGVLMGGESSERDISIRSGLAIYQSLQELGYIAAPIDISKDIVNTLKKEKIKFAFLALHGGIGENGAIQGMLEVLRIPYTGSGVLASALAMDKEASKKIFLYHGLAVAPFIVVSQKSKVKSQKLLSPLAKGGQLGGNSELQTPNFPLPWVVKPVSEGSSIGVSIVKEEKDLASCLEKAFAFDQRAMIEKFIPGKEIHIGILGQKVLGGVEVRPSLEFYNYEAKYTSGLTDYIIPPEIDEPVYESVKDAALRAHMALGCSGASRVDFRIDEISRIPHVLEVNTLPGMTTTSLLPKIAKSAGMSFNGLLEEIIRLALKE